LSQLEALSCHVVQANFVAAALIWPVPDRRIKRVLRHNCAWSIKSAEPVTNQKAVPSY
jgi:hypothetical protein